MLECQLSVGMHNHITQIIVTAQTPVYMVNRNVYNPLVVKC